MKSMYIPFLDFEQDCFVFENSCTCLNCTVSMYSWVDIIHLFCDPKFYFFTKFDQIFLIESKLCMYVCVCLCITYFAVVHTKQEFKHTRRKGFKPNMIISMHREYH